MPLDIAALTVTQTDVGLGAMANLENTGLAFEVSHLAFGDANGTGYTPDRSETELRNERVRVPISPTGSKRLSNNSHLVQGVVADAPVFWCREIGIIGSDGTLLAVWSHPTSARWQKRDGFSILVAYTFYWGAFDADNITLLTGGPDVNILVERELNANTTAILDLQHRWINEYNRDFQESRK